MLEDEITPPGASKIPEVDELALGASFGNEDVMVGAIIEVGIPPVDPAFTEAIDVGTTTELAEEAVGKTITEGADPVDLASVALVGTTAELVFAEVGGIITDGDDPVDPAFDEAIDVGTTIELADEAVGETITDGTLPVDATVFLSLTTELGAFDGDSVDTGAIEVFDEAVGETTTDGGDPVDPTLL